MASWPFDAVRSAAGSSETADIPGRREVPNAGLTDGALNPESQSGSGPAQTADGRMIEASLD
jgi:hypothetical protein